MRQALSLNEDCLVGGRPNRVGYKLADILTFAIIKFNLNVSSLSASILAVGSILRLLRRM